MKRLIPLSVALATSLPLLAVEVDPALDRAVRATLPVCSAETTITYAELPMKLPPRFRGVLLKVESPRPACAGQYTAVVSPGGGVFVGSPWPLDGETGAPDEKIRSFVFHNMHEHMTVTIEPTRTVDGLLNATLTQTLEGGKLPMHGAVDADGRVFFFGQFRRLDGDPRAERAKALERFIRDSPSKGPANAPVTIVEFSDFQCPSCRRASGYADAVLAKHGENVRYVRFDLPLTGHAWAFPASLAGRAIYRQNPELFWKYKNQVYAEQSDLSAFTFWDWARAWAEDHELDMARYDADLRDETIRTSIFSGAGAAFSNDIRATPSYMVNGALVDAGEDGSALLAYVDSLVK